MMDAKYRDELLKLCTKMSRSPFLLHDAAAFLTAWASGNQPRKEPLDISYVQDALSTMTRPVLSLRLNTVEVDPLEVMPNALRIMGPPREQDPSQKPSAWAKTVYPVAIHYHLHFQKPWPDAMAEAKKLWRQAGNVLDEAADNQHDEVLPDDDVAPLLALM
jgi:hypothetical protein